MKVNNIQSETFGAVKLGRGGAKRLANTMPLTDAKTMIGKNFRTKSRRQRRTTTVS